MNNRLRNTIYRCHQAISSAYEADLAKAQVNITGQQATVLEAIQNLDGASQSAIVDLTGIDRSTMADVVRRLVNKGLVTRKKTRSDARRYELHLTTAGKEATLRAGMIANQIEASLALQRPTAMKGLEGKLMSIIDATRGEGLQAAE